MKYELEPDNYGCADDVLLDDLRSTARRLNKEGLTKDEYNEHGRFSAATIQKRFGSWNKALLLSGLNTRKRVSIPPEELTADLVRVANELQTRTVTGPEYSLLGNFSHPPMHRAFGSWAKALSAAGLEPSIWKPKTSDDELFDNMAAVWEQVGRQPKKKDFRAPVSKFSADPYVRRHGSWRKALEAFVTAANSDEEFSEVQAEETSKVTSHTAPEPQDAHKTNRNPSWRLRFLVMRRDNFACQLCGASPAKNPAVSLHLDHVVAWSEGGETVFTNLQTCCETCNIGKSNLAITSQ